jgi:Zn-dependent peptidase ImmA (M78 family)
MTLAMLVMCSGVVLNNNTRRLDPEEFRGFALTDPLAPLVFVNGSDTKGAQMFTLAHELAHVWLGESGVFDPIAGREPVHAVERWCNHVAAELLVPLDILRAEHVPRNPLPAEIERLARRFKVSTLVILRRIHDAGSLSWDALWGAYETELARILARPSGTGGNFHLTTAARVSKRFARALVISTWEGRSSFTEAFSLLGIKKVETLRGLSDSLGIAI